jgi:hypothetical protein
MKSKYFQTFNIYNLGFFGTYRERSDVSGHFRVALDTKDMRFAILEAYEYGGFQHLGDPQEIKPLTDNDIRYFNDYFLKDKGWLKGYESKEETEVPDETVWYPLSAKPIGANIHYGDEIVDLRTGEKMIVPRFWEIMEVNRNYFYKHTDPERAKLHPEPMKRKDFLKRLAEIDPFKGWYLKDSLPKKKDLQCTLTVNGDLYNYYEESPDDRQQYVECVATGKIYNTHDNTSGSKYELHRRLAGEVYSKYEDGTSYHYAVHECTSNSIFWTKQFKKEWAFINYRHFTEEESYYYNTAETHLR